MIAAGWFRFLQKKMRRTRKRRVFKTGRVSAAVRSFIAVGVILFLPGVLPPQKAEAGSFQNFSGKYHVIGSESVRSGGRRAGALSSSHASFQYQWKTVLLRKDAVSLGFFYDRLDLASSPAILLPDRLHSLRARIGLEKQWGPRVALRFEVAPGLASDMEDVGWKDAVVGGFAGMSLVQNPDLIWLVGVSGSSSAEYKIMGIAGVRWQISRRWLLSAMPPEVRLKFSPAPPVDFFIGPFFHSDVYRVSDRFGAKRNIALLDGAHLQARDWGMEGGWVWRPRPAISLEGSVGYCFYRRYAFEDTPHRYEGFSAPAAGLSLNARF